MDGVAELERATSADSPDLLPLARGFRILFEARTYALELGLDVWEFAVEIRSLLEVGFSLNDLRCIHCRGFADHAAETTQSHDLRRSFRPVSNLRFEESSCFVLTQLGAHFAQVAFSHPPRGSEVLVPQKRDVVPVWDHARQELRIDGVVVKQFKAPAPNQEAILAAFQEEGWPARIDDPIPPQFNQDSKRRLHDTITALNRNQKVRLIKFLGDGHGLGVRWEPVVASLQAPVVNGKPPV